ncbi:hypothetical protein BMS3Bbin01_03024 [bacterium BMS3Bbin01]|nr:hypothetical protein BMS3Bbin01_03024 [bacterium BMS3Bbin01]
MMTMGDDAKAAVVLTTRLGRRDRPALSPAVWHSLVQALQDAGLRPGDLFRGEEVIDRTAVAEDLAARVRALIEDTVAVTVEVDTLAGKGIRVVTYGDEHYPVRYRRRLGTQAPPVLFTVGDLGLLGGGGVGIVGSRNVDPAGAAVAREVAGYAARGGLPVFSGGARGVDQLAMAAALDAGGSVVGVLADSLERQIRKPDTLAALDGGQICLITQQHPRAGFSVGAAMGRNKLIYALADVTVVVASDRGRGGTWQGAVEALRHGYGNVAVWRGAGEGAGNTELEKSGALPLTAVERLDELASGDDAAPPVQMTMLD